MRDIFLMVKLLGNVGKGSYKVSIMEESMNISIDLHHVEAIRGYQSYNYAFEGYLCGLSRPVAFDRQLCVLSRPVGIWDNLCD